MKSRKDWGAKAPRKALKVNPADIKGVCIHWGATMAPGNGESTWRSYQNYHLGRGWYDIAYNFGVDLEGNVYEGRGMHTRSGAQGGNKMNKEWIAVCAIMGPSNTVTSEMTAGIRSIVAEIQGAYPNALAIVPHRALKATHCPGDTLTDLIEGKAFVTSRMVAPPSVPRPTLARGATGEDVKRLQKTLKAKADGDFGPKTEARLIEVQGCISPWLGGVDGVCGKKVWRFVEWTEGL